MSKDGRLVEEKDVITSQVDAKTNSNNSNKNQISQQVQHEGDLHLEQLNLIDEHKVIYDDFIPRETQTGEREKDNFQTTRIGVTMTMYFSLHSLNRYQIHFN